MVHDSRDQDHIQHAPLEHTYYSMRSKLTLAVSLSH